MGPAFWNDLGRHIIEQGKPPIIKTYPEKPMSDSAGMHRWWYGCPQRAGIVPTGTTSGERMHKARHTAGQRILDKPAI